MNEERLPLKLLTNEWDKVRIKGYPKKSWLGQVNLLKKELNLPEKFWR